MWGPFSRTAFSRRKVYITDVVLVMSGQGFGLSDWSLFDYWPNPFQFVSEPVIEQQVRAATKVIIVSPDAQAVVELTDVPPERQIERVVNISYGDEDICREVGHKLLDNWRADRLTVTGDIPLNVALDFRKAIRVIIPNAGIDQLFVIQKKEHNLSNHTTTLTLGDVRLSEEELLSRILNDLESQA